MTIRLNGALSRCLAGLALGGLIAFAFAPPATAQWLRPPWGAPFPGDIARSLEARGYVLTAPLMRRPGVYLADVSAGPAGYRRLIVDATSGQILESFPAPGRMWRPVLASRDAEFGGPASPGVGGPPLGGAFSNPPGGSPPAKSAYRGSGNVHIPAAISPYGPAAAPLSTKPKSRVASLEHKIPATKAPLINPPLPPPAPRAAARADEPGPPQSQPAANEASGQPRVTSHPAEAENASPAAAPTTQGSSTEASDKPKVSIVPAAPFE
jgi:hypothetical protein